MKIAPPVLLGCMVLLAAVLLPLPIRPYLDFQVIYHADMGLLRGIPIYDHAGQVSMIAQLARVSADQVFVLPFPYPPWYALATLWLVLLPIDAAARLWFGVNLIMLFLSIVWLTNGWPAPKRLLVTSCAILFVPVLGSLFVGQYGFPVLLGAALMTRALRRHSAALTGISAAMLTFKPHLGALVLIIVVVHLWQRRDDFGRRSLLAIALSGTILFAAGFLASPLWPVDYYHSLTGFKDVSQCHQCVSVPMALASLVGAGFSQAVWIAAGISVVLAAFLVRRWRPRVPGPSQLVVGAVLLTFLVSPYLQNYDYVLLVVPFLALAAIARGVGWLWLTLAYALPLGSLALLGSAGNVSLVFSACVLFGIAAGKIGNIDAPAFTSS